MLTTGSEVIRIMGPPAVPIGIPVTFTCRRTITNIMTSIQWRLNYTSAGGSTQSVTTLFGTIMDLMSTVANFKKINESVSELVLNTTNRSITSIECSTRDRTGIARSSRNVVVYGKFCLLHIGSYIIVQIKLYNSTLRNLFKTCLIKISFIVIDTIIHFEFLKLSWRTSV